MAGRRNSMNSMKQKMKDILLIDRSLCLIENSDLDFSEQYVKNLIHKNRSAFKNCNTIRAIVPPLQQTIITKEIEILLKEAGLSWPAGYERNLALNWESVFRACKTREDAIQRLKYLDKIINKKTALEI